MNRCENHGDCVRRVMDFAGELCREKGLRLTPLRRRVLETVSGDHRPMKAYKVLAAVSASGSSASGGSVGDGSVSGSSAMPPTVYRALDFLMENGLVHKLHSSSSYYACFHPASRHAECFFLICSECGGAEEFCGDGLKEAIDGAARGEGFEKSGAVVEVLGTCRECKRGRGV